MTTRPNSTPARALVASTLLLLLASGCKDYPNAKRSVPICAVRDCKTGQIIDDGCAANGKCKSCINDCGGRVAPRNGPATAPLPIR